MVVPVVPIVNVNRLHTVKPERDSLTETNVDRDKQVNVGVAMTVNVPPVTTVRKAVAS